LAANNHAQKSPICARFFLRKNSCRIAASYLSAPESALQEAAVYGSIDPHFESGARQKKARLDGGRLGTVARTLAVVRKCREDGLRGPKPPLSIDAARLGEREGGRHCRHRRPDFCAHCHLSMAMTKPNKVVERTCISHIARDRVATNRSR
jgi:hypothetical protein